MAQFIEKFVFLIAQFIFDRLIVLIEEHVALLLSLVDIIDLVLLQFVKHSLLELSDILFPHITNGHFIEFFHSTFLS